MLKTFYYLGCHLFGFTPDELAKAIQAHNNKEYAQVFYPMMRRSSALFNRLANGDLRFGNQKKS